MIFLKYFYELIKFLISSPKMKFHRINSGFEEQLGLYESLRCDVDTSSPVYKQYRLQKITEKYPGTTTTHKHTHIQHP